MDLKPQAKRRRAGAASTLGSNFEIQGLCATKFSMSVVKQEFGIQHSSVHVPCVMFCISTRLAVEALTLHIRGVTTCQPLGFA